MSSIDNEKAAVAVEETSTTSHSLSTDEPSQTIDAEKNASEGGTYFVTERSGSNLKTAKDGVTVLIPQPSDDTNDPLNWSWGRKHKVLFSLLLPSLLTDWGMTYGTTMFEAQAITWGMSVPEYVFLGSRFFPPLCYTDADYNLQSVARSVSGGIFLQGPGGVIAVPFVQRYGR